MLIFLITGFDVFHFIALILLLPVVGYVLFKEVNK